MNHLISQRLRSQFARQIRSQIRSYLTLLLLGMLLSAPVLWAQQPAATQGLDPQTAQALLQRVDQLEARLKDVEAALAKTQTVNTGQTQSQPSVPPQAAPPPETPSE